MSDARKIDQPEAIALGLPLWHCCCDDHMHDWYEIADADETWVECGACATGARFREVPAP